MSGIGREKWLAEDGNSDSLLQPEQLDLFQDMFGLPQKRKWERTTDENGGRVFRKKDGK